MISLINYGGKMFSKELNKKLDKYHFKITTLDAKLWAPQIAEKIK